MAVSYTHLDVYKRQEENIMNRNLKFDEMVDFIIDTINNNGLISMEKMKGGWGSLAMPRKQEIMATYNRYRKLKI